MSVIGKRKTPKSERTPSVEESLKIEEVVEANKEEKNLLHHIQKILSPLVAILIHTYKREELSNPLGVSLEAQTRIQTHCTSIWAPSV
jgi:hypothetical protein